MQENLLENFEDYRCIILENDSDIEKICALFELVFKHPMNKDVWTWKYKSAPEGAYIGVGVKDNVNNQLIGHMGVLIAPGIFNNTPIVMGQVCDVMLHPSYRSGIGKDSLYQRMHSSLGKLSRYWRNKNNNINLYMYGFPGTRPAKLGTRLKFYRHLYICKENSYLSQSKFQSKFDIYNIWPLKFKFKRINDYIDGANKVLLDNFWEIFSSKNSHNEVLIKKNSDYLNWRYFKKPNQNSNINQYCFWIFYRLGNIIGWMVTSTSPHSMVIDYCFLDRNLNLNKALNAISTPGTLWIYWEKNNNNSTLTPINAVEFLGDQFYNSWPVPIFQPGDTDVF